MSRNQNLGLSLWFAGPLIIAQALKFPPDSIGRKKYGKKKFNKAAAEGKSLRGAAAKRIKNKMVDYSKQNASYS